MSSYLNKLIEDVKRELDHERARVELETFATKRIEVRETGNLKRLEQRVQVLEQLKVKEAATNRRRALSFARASRDRGHGSAQQRPRQGVGTRHVAPATIQAARLDQKRE